MKLFQLLFFIFLGTSFFAQNKYAYPIVFIHGSASSDATWEKTFTHLKNRDGLGDINVFDVALNADDDNTNASLTNDIKWDDVVYQGTTIHLGKRNFEVDILNTTDGWIGDNVFAINFQEERFKGNQSTEYFEESNESAIYKQGKAIGVLINEVLNHTGKDKVILVAHSMGGLAVREYLQRTDPITGEHINWVYPNESVTGHRVARFVTYGTPHLGQNGAPDPTRSENPDVLGETESNRDMIWEYQGYTPPYDNITPAQGIYLFGGNELYVASTSTHSTFPNADINCNGFEGDTIIGINEGFNSFDYNPSMPLPTNLPYTYIVGKIGCILGLCGDGLIDQDRQYLHNSSNYVSPVGFSDTVMTKVLHTSQGGDVRGIIRGIDEPESFGFAYEISQNNNYIGYITSQMFGDLYDQDMYKIDCDGDVLDVIIRNNLSGLDSIIIYNNLYQRVYETPIFNQSGLSRHTIDQLIPGTYFISLKGTATSISWEHPYGLMYYTTNTVACKDVFFSEYLSTATDGYLEIYNPTLDSISLSDYNLCIASNGSQLADTFALGNYQIYSQDVFVIAEASSQANIKDSADVILPSNLTFDGNDAIFLTKNSGQDTVDIIGVIGQNTGPYWSGGGVATYNMVLIRKQDVNQGINSNPVSFNPSVAWDSLLPSNFSDLGWHSSVCSQSFSEGDVYDTINAIICSGDYYSLNEKQYYTTGQYVDTLVFPLFNNIVTLNLTVIPLHGNGMDTICIGDTILLGNTIITSAGVYVDTILNSLLCDSIVELTVTAEYCCDTIIDSLSFDLCLGDSVSVGNTNYFVGGIYNDTLLTNYGCDSILYIVINEIGQNKLSSFYDTICEGDVYSFGGNVCDVSGVYYDTLVSNTGCDSVLKLTLFVRNLPGVVANSDLDTIMEGQTVNFNTNGSDASYFLWSFGDNTYSSLIAVSHTYNMSGIYEVVLKGDNIFQTCSNYDTLNIVVHPFVSSVVENKNTGNIKIYPNPTKDKIWLTVDLVNRPIQATLMDAKGAIINQFVVMENKELLDISALQKGVYILQLQGEGVQEEFKLIKE